jgi:hypothetical protein
MSPPTVDHFDPALTDSDVRVAQQPQRSARDNQRRQTEFLRTLASSKHGVNNGYRKFGIRRFLILIFPFKLVRATD